MLISEVTAAVSKESWQPSGSIHSVPLERIWEPSISKGNGDGRVTDKPILESAKEDRAHSAL